MCTTNKCKSKKHNPSHKSPVQRICASVDVHFSFAGEYIEYNMCRAIRYYLHANFVF